MLKASQLILNEGRDDGAIEIVHAFRGIQVEKGRHIYISGGGGVEGDALKGNANHKSIFMPLPVHSFFISIAKNLQHHLPSVKGLSKLKKKTDDAVGAQRKNAKQSIRIGS